MEVARSVSPFFKNVYLVGHPSLSAEVASEGNIELKISSNNSDTIKHCAEAGLIITQHSGAVHLGAYVNTPVLIIFNGTPPMRGLIDTIRFRANLTDVPLNYAFSLDEIENFAAAVNNR
jgi:ADP-heptose:LPS heptosyltransferase